MDFCGVAGIDSEECFAYDESLVNTKVVAAEADLLCAFMAYVVAFPRSKKPTNTGRYARQVLSSVLSYYEDRLGRKQGANAEGNPVKRIRCVAKGLRVIAPASLTEKKPVLQYHLRAIKEQMNLSKNGFHRVCWSAWLMQWQGVLRSGDLIRSKGGSRRSWAAHLDTHRDLLEVGVARGLDGRPVGAGFKLRLKPTKTDRSGEKKLSRTFVLDERAGSLSAAVAIRDMLIGDPHIGDGSVVPLLRDPTHGGELKYEDSLACFKRMARKAGFPELADGLQSLRRGGATAIANSRNGGEMAMRASGAWTSDARWKYVWASEEKMAEVSMAIGRESGRWELTGRLG